MLVVVGGDEIDTGCDGGFPAGLGGLAGAEVVGFAPALVVLRGEAIDGVEANPEALFMGVIDEGAEAGVVFGGPGAGLALAAFFDDVPGVVPPAAVVGGGCGEDHFGGRCGGVSAGGGVGRAEEAEIGADGEGIEEDGFLGVVVFSKDEERFQLQGLEGGGVGCFWGGGDPGFVFAEEVPEGVVEFGAVVFEIEVEGDEGPGGGFVFAESLFDEGADVFEEIVAEGGFVAGGFGGVGDDGAAEAGGFIDAPGEVLFDTDGEAGGEGAREAIGPFAFVGVAVVSVEKGAGEGLGGEGAEEEQEADGRSHGDR